jgi:hypothetical protein
MDKCRYCGIEYHPMRVYTLVKAGDAVKNYWLDGAPSKPLQVNVCSLRVEGEGENMTFDFQYRDCIEKAEADGYTFRPDLTPSR